MIQFSPYAKTDDEFAVLWHEFRKLGRWALDDNGPTAEEFRSIFDNPANLFFHVLDDGADVGYMAFYQQSIYVADLHGLFFDLRWKGRVERVNQLVEAVMSTHGWLLVRGYAIDGHRTTDKLYRNAGWMPAGRLPGIVFRKGELVGATIYYVTKEMQDAWRQRREGRLGQANTDDQIATEHYGGTERVDEDLDGSDVPKWWISEYLRRVQTDGPEGSASSEADSGREQSTRFAKSVGWWRTLWGNSALAHEPPGTGFRYRSSNGRREWSGRI